MGAPFSGTTSISGVEGSLEVGLVRRFEMLDRCEFHVGLVYSIFGEGTITHGVVEEVTVGHNRTYGLVRIISPAEVLALGPQSVGFIDNYILAVKELVSSFAPGLIFVAQKNEQRLYPVGSPIDLAIGHDFVIVGSVVVEEITVSYNLTQITARVLTVYSPEESVILTRLNQERERANGRG